MAHAGVKVMRRIDLICLKPYFLLTLYILPILSLRVQNMLWLLIQIFDQEIFLLMHSRIFFQAICETDLDQILLV